MSTKKQSGRTETQRAIVELRKHLGMTQQQLSTLMGVTLTSVGRWETTRPPRGFYLWHLAFLAKQSTQPHLQRIFLEGLAKGSGEDSRLLQSLKDAKEAPRQLLEALNSAIFHLSVCTNFFDYQGLPLPVAHSYQLMLEAIRTAHLDLLTDVRSRRIPVRPDALEQTQLLLEEAIEYERIRSKADASK
jgi:transcriptional regulator with XRE-family HTH domain